jgi:polyisoprenoid-binding protein YceI
MKNLKTIALALIVALGTFSATAQTTKKVDATKSQIKWVGKKVTGQHEGTINLQDGALIFDGKKLVGGNFTINMSTISTTDLKSGDGKEDLDGHLKADDFFGTEKFPTSTLVFKTIAKKGKNVYSVTADLTIKEKTNPIKFDITVAGNKATTALKVDRTKYDIKFKSKNFFENLGNRAIEDEFELNVALLF